MQNQITTYNQYQPMALAGFFRWLRDAVNKVTNVLKPFLPSPIYNILNDFTDGDGRFFGVNTGSLLPPEKTIGLGTPRTSGLTLDEFEQMYPIDASDRRILDLWLNTFTNTLQTYFASIANAKDIIAAHNKLYQFIAVLEYATANNLQVAQGTISNNAIQLRNAFIDIQIAALEDTIKSKLEEQNLDLQYTTVTATVNGFSWRNTGIVFDNRFDVTYEKAEYQSILQLDNDGIVIDPRLPNDNVPNNPILQNTPTDQLTTVLEDEIIEPLTNSDFKSGLSQRDVLVYGFAALVIYKLTKK